MFNNSILILATIMLSGLQSFAQDSLIITLPGARNDINAVTYSPARQKRMVAAGWDNEIFIYKTDSPFQLVQKLRGHEAAINCLTYNWDGKILASGGSDMTMHLWDSMYRPFPILEDPSHKHESAITSIIFDKGGKFFFSGDKNGKLIIWDLSTKKSVRSYPTGNTINDLSLSPNPANVFVAQNDPKIKLIALTTGNVVRTLDGHTDAVNSIAISFNNQYLISGSNDKTARIWDLKTWKPLFVLKPDCWKVTCVAFTDDAKYCVTGCNNGTVCVWETSTGKLIGKREFGAFNIRDIAFSKDNSMLLLGIKSVETNEYGARIIPSMIPGAFKGFSREVSSDPMRRAVDSILAIRPLTKQDSIKYKSILISPKDGNTGKKPTSSKDNSGNGQSSATIYQTPASGPEKKKK